jgi:chemotaxis signal transduction protein
MTAPGAAHASRPASDPLIRPQLAADSSHHFLAVCISGRRFALRREEVREVVLLTELLEVPGMPRHLVGFCVHRGAVWPVVDLAQVLGDGQAAVTSASAMIFLAGTWQVALLVDEAVGLHASAGKMEDIEPGCTWNEAVAGVAELEGETVPVIACQRVMSEEEQQRLEEWCLLAQRRLEAQPRPPADAVEEPT